MARYCFHGILFSCLLASDFDMILTKRRDSYLNYTEIPDLGSFTLCFWMRQSYSPAFEYWVQTILSYANEQSIQAIELKSVGGANNGVLLSYMGSVVL